MMNVKERYQHDSVFHALVQMFYREYEKIENYGGAGLTPTEIREASGLAWQMYYERNASPLLFRETR